MGIGIDRPYDLFYSKANADFMCSDLEEFNTDEFKGFQKLIDPIDRWDMLRDYMLVGTNCWMQERSHHSYRTDMLC